MPEACGPTWRAGLPVFSLQVSSPGWPFGWGLCFPLLDQATEQRLSFSMEPPIFSQVLFSGSESAFVRPRNSSSLKQGLHFLFFIGVTQRQHLGCCLTYKSPPATLGYLPFYSSLNLTAKLSTKYSMLLCNLCPHSSTASPGSTAPSSMLEFHPKSTYCIGFPLGGLGHSVITGSHHLYKGFPALLLLPSQPVPGSHVFSTVFLVLLFADCLRIESAVCSLFRLPSCT